MRIKQYLKEGRALRTETVMCDTGDFGSARCVCAQNWNALRAVRESANRCLCDAEAADAQPVPDVATFCQVTRPSTMTMVSIYAAGLRFGEQRVMAILAALVGFCYLVAGFTDRHLGDEFGHVILRAAAPIIAVALGDKEEAQPSCVLWGHSSWSDSSSGSSLLQPFNQSPEMDYCEGGPQPRRVAGKTYPLLFS